MLSCKSTYNLYSIKTEWIELQENGCQTSPFLNFEYVLRSWKYFYPYYLTAKYIARFFCFYDNGKCVMILPTAYYLGTKELCLLGNVNGWNYTGALVTNQKYIAEALKLLSQRFVCLGGAKVLESTEFWTGLKDQIVEEKVVNNVCIHFGLNYDVYNKTLSKSTRQNLRTAYNRLISDGKNLRIEFLEGGSRFDYRPLIDLYCKRHEERYGVKTNIIKKWFLLHQSFATQNYLKHPDALTIVLYIDDSIAAFMSGLKGRNKEYVVPRLSIDEKFGFYSPGMLLINESIKYFIRKGEIEHLDLSQGEEQYKYKMGGELHHTHSFMVKLT